MDCEGDILDDEDQELENFPITLKLVQMVEITVVPILPFCTVDRVSVDETPFTLRVAAEMSILEVMKMIEEETGIPVSHQRLQTANLLTNCSYDLVCHMWDTTRAR